MLERSKSAAKKLPQTTHHGNVIPFDQVVRQFVFILGSRITNHFEQTKEQVPPTTVTGRFSKTSNHSSSGM